VQCVIDQYSKFSPIPGVHVNGKLTQGENIADMGGIKNSFHALSTLLGTKVKDPSIVPKLSRGQLFFVAFAQGWCTKASDAYYRLHAATDPHSPPMFRVLGPLMNLPAFSTTFNCPVGSPMNPVDRCEVW
jgi:putative endopeptidase